MTKAHTFHIYCGTEFWMSASSLDWAQRKVAAFAFTGLDLRIEVAPWVMSADWE